MTTNKPFRRLRFSTPIRLGLILILLTTALGMLPAPMTKVAQANGSQITVGERMRGFQFDGVHVVEGDHTPAAWQTISGQQTPSPASFRSLAVPGESLRWSEPDPAPPPTIPPSLQWNTFMGSLDNDYGQGIAIDESNNMYMIGESWAAWGSPINPYSGGIDTFVAKLNSSGALQWHTFIGASSNDEGRGIAIDGNGNIYVTGRSQDTWGEPINPHIGDYDIFVAKLSNSGDLLWNTFLGSSDTDIDEGITIDRNGNVYVIGESPDTWGDPVAPHIGYYDAFVAKLDNSGDLQWNTFMGASSHDMAQGIATDKNGNVYTTGYSQAVWGDPINTHTGGQEAFVAQLDSNGDLQWNTFMGSSNNDYGRGIIIDRNDNVYVTGESSAGWGSPINLHTGGKDAFVVQLNSSGDLQWNTFMGTPCDDYGRDITIDGNGAVYVTGRSQGPWGSPLNPHAGEGDVFAAELDSNGDLQWNTFIGSSSDDNSQGIAVDKGGNIYIAGTSQATWGSPIRSFAGGWIDSFVAKIGWPVVTKVADDDTPDPGQPITFTILVRPVVSDTGGIISDILPSHLAFAGPITLDPPQPWATRANDAGDLPTLVSNLTITAGESLAISFPVTVNTPLTGGLSIVNTAALTTSTKITTPETGSVQLIVAKVAPVANDATFNTDEDTPLYSSLSADDANGDSLTYGAFANPVAGTAAITDTTTGGFVYTPTNQATTYTDTFTFIVTDTTNLTDTVTVSIAVNADLDADLSITKTVTPIMPIRHGETVTYTLIFANHGPDPATSVLTITDSIPVSVTHTSVMSVGAIIAPISGTHYVWNVASLDMGQVGIITISGVLNAPMATGDFTNTATITSTAGDNDTSNNSSDTSVTVVSPDIAVAPTSLVFAQNIDAGPSVTQTVIIANDGSADLSISSVNLSGADAVEFNVGSDTGTGTLIGPLSPGSTRTVQVSFDPSIIGSKSATLTIQSDDSDEPTVDVSLSGTGVANQAPVADAGDDQTLVINSTFTLDSSGSSDPDSNLPLSYLWTQSGSLAIILGNGTIALSPTFTAPGTPAVLIFTLVVTDALGLPSTPDTVVITVTTYRVFLPLIVQN